MSYIHKPKFQSAIIGLVFATIIGISPANFPATAIASESYGIEVTSPVKDATYELGDSVPIKWSNLTTNVRAIDIKISLIPRTPACLYTVPTCDMATPAPYIITETTSDDGSYDWRIPTNLSTTYHGEVQVKIEGVDSSIWGQSDSFQIKAKSNPTEAHPVGSLVLGLDGSPNKGALIVEVGDTTKRKAFPSAEIFISHGYKWGKFVPANSADQALPTTENFTFSRGSLIKSNNNATVYLVSADKTLRPFSSWDLFVQYGYKANMIWSISNLNLNDYTISSAITNLERHVDGTEVVQNGTVYYIDSGVLHPYPNLEIYNSWHTYDNDFSRVVPANTYDNALPIGSFQVKRYYPY